VCVCLSVCVCLCVSACVCVCVSVCIFEGFSGAVHHERETKGEVISSGEDKRPKKSGAWR